MKTLQEYMLENINEGKLWDAIKNWFNRLFSDGEEKEYDRFTGDYNEVKYVEYIKANIDIKKYKLEHISERQLKYIIDGEHKLNSESNFSEFLDEPSSDNKSKFCIITYIDKNVNDIAAMIKLSLNDVKLKDYVEIEKIQISPIFSKYLKLNYIIKKIQQSDIVKGKKGMYCDRHVNFNLYDKLVDYCRFVGESNKYKLCVYKFKKNSYTSNRITSNTLNEDIDDNIFWKIDTYFQNNDNDLKAFNGLVDVCRANKGFNVNTIEAYVSGNELISKNQKKFIDFIEDNVQPDPSINKDYSAALYNVVKTVIGNKSDGLKYTNNI